MHPIWSPNNARIICTNVRFLESSLPIAIPIDKLSASNMAVNSRTRDGIQQS